MIQITPHMRILVAVEPVDFRAGIDGLAAACRKRLQAEPMTGTLFVFASRRRTTVRILAYDGHGARATVLEQRLHLHPALTTQPGSTQPPSCKICIRGHHCLARIRD